MSFDVIVLGAGPGGSTTARYLARHGLEVCLIDKDTFPRDKPCGGGYSAGLFDDFPYLKKRRDNILEGICKVGVLHSPNRMTTLRAKIDMAVSLRTDFDYALVLAAEDAGADLKSGTQAKDFDISESGVKVRTDKGTFKGRALIGADGVSSLVARKTGLNRRWPSSSITACRVAEIPVAEHVVTETYGDDKEYHFYANLFGRPGYGWIFPKRNTINVGLGIVAKESKGLPGVFQSFLRFLKKEGKVPENSDLSMAKGALVPTGGTLSKTYLDRCLLVGDSAGMVSPLTGGGIGFAMSAGRIAANVIAEAAEDDNFTSERLEVYQKLWMKHFGYQIKPQLLAQRIFTGPFTNVLFEIGRRDSVLQEMVSMAMSETSDFDLDVTRLTMRAIYTVIRAALHV